MTARRVLEDIAESLYSGGYRTAVMVNIHGGNWILKPTMIEINRRHEAFRIISTGDILSYRGQVKECSYLIPVSPAAAHGAR